MNVTIVCDVLGEVNNGTTLATMNLINYLKRKGHNLTIICPNPNKANEKDYVIVPTLNLGKFLNGIVEKNGVTLAKVDKDILRENIKNADLVHIQIPLILGTAAVEIAREFNKPVTASFHCQAENITAHVGLMNAKLANKVIYKKFYKNIYRYCDRVHYPTQFIRDVFENTTDKTNGVVISNGVAEEFFAPCENPIKNDKFTIVCTGRYSKEKAQWQLIKAVAASKHKDEIKIILAGNGPYEGLLRKRAAKLNVDMELNFYTREELIRMLHGANLYVHTAIIEIEAIACMEAITCGLVPVICNSPRSATKSFAIDSNNLFKPKCIKDLTEKIDFWFENPDKVLEYKEKYKKMSEGFALENCMKEMENMLINALNEKEKSKDEKEKGN